MNNMSLEQVPQDDCRSFLSFENFPETHHPEIKEIFDQLMVIDSVSRLSTQSVSTLNEQLRMSKLFLNMVIHDLKNPTSSIKIGLEDTIFEIKDIEKIFQDQEKFIAATSDFNSKIKGNIKKFR